MAARRVHIRVHRCDPWFKFPQREDCPTTAVGTTDFTDFHGQRVAAGVFTSVCIRAIRGSDSHRDKTAPLPRLGPRISRISTDREWQPACSHPCASVPSVVEIPQRQDCPTTAVGTTDFTDEWQPGVFTSMCIGGYWESSKASPRHAVSCIESMRPVAKRLPLLDPLHLGMRFSLCIIWMGLIGVSLWLAFRAQSPDSAGRRPSDFRLQPGGDVEIGNMRVALVDACISGGFSQTAFRFSVSLQPKNVLVQLNCGIPEPARARSPMAREPDTGGHGTARYARGDE